MSLLYAEGFDDFNVQADAAGRVSSYAGLSFAASARGGKYMRVPENGGSATFNLATPATTTSIVGMSLSVATYTGYSYAYLYFRDNANIIFFLRSGAAGQLQCRSAADALITTIAYNTGLSSYIEFKITPGNPGTLIIHVDGVEVFNSSSVDLNSSTTKLNNISIVGGSQEPGWYVDDLYVCDSDGSYNNDFLGNTHVASAPPTGDGADLEMTPSTGSDHYPLVAESPMAGDSSYVSAPSAPLSDTYTFPAVDLGAIRAVQLVAYAKTVSGGVDKLAAVARVGGVDYPQADQFVPPNYQGLATIMETNPGSGTSPASPWTKAAVDAAEFGVKRTV